MLRCRSAQTKFIILIADSYASASAPNIEASSCCSNKERERGREERSRRHHQNREGEGEGEDQLREKVLERGRILRLERGNEWMMVGGG